MSETPARSLSPLPLDGRTAVVTGAAGGIGAAICRSLTSHGAFVVCVDLAQEAQAVADELGGVALVGDLSSRETCRDVVSLALQQGSLDILVNCAGIQVRTEAVAIDPASWQRLLDVNLTVPYQLIQEATEALVASGGSIVNIASLSADRAVPGIVPYGATKAALVQLTRGLAAELGPQGVRVNAVAPGYIDTPMTREVLDQSEFRDRVLARIPLRRLADGTDVADVVTFLSSPAARYVTGVMLPVDGGYAIT